LTKRKRRVFQPFNGETRRRFLLSERPFFDVSPSNRPFAQAVASNDAAVFWFRAASSFSVDGSLETAYSSYFNAIVE
jgi:hypothetical protein